MAAAKKAAAKKVAKKRARRRRRIYRRRAFLRTPAQRKWDLWNHDVDTLLHQLVQNPALVTESPREIVQRAEKFADELHAMQDRRRPKGVEESWR